MRRAASAAVFAGGSLFAYSRWTRWVEGMPTLEPPSGSLIASADAESPAACAVCAPVHARDLAGLGVTSRGGSNYATLDAALLETILDRLVAAHARTTTPSAAASVGGDSSTATADRGSRHARSDFGPERLIDTSTPSLWLAVSVREPRWVGDDQMVRPFETSARTHRKRRSRLHVPPTHTQVLLCAGYPPPDKPYRATEAWLLPVYLRLLLGECAEQIVGEARAEEQRRRDAAKT